MADSLDKALHRLECFRLFNENALKLSWTPIGRTGDECEALGARSVDGALRQNQVHSAALLGPSRNVLRTLVNVRA